MKKKCAIACWLNCSTSSSSANYLSKYFLLARFFPFTFNENSGKCTLNLVPLYTVDWVKNGFASLYPTWEKKKKFRWYAKRLFIERKLQNLSSTTCKRKNVKEADGSKRSNYFISSLRTTSLRTIDWIK